MSNIFYDGRNYIPVPNSKSKCLLENYVEERAVADLEREKKLKKEQSLQEDIRDGHNDIISINRDAPIMDLTTDLDVYRPPTGPSYRTKGTRRELREQLAFEQAVKEINAESEPFVDECVSTTQQDFNHDNLVISKPCPTIEHNYFLEQPVTFWTEHRDKIHSVTQVKPTFNSCFRKNTAFSRPISERWEPDHVRPHEHDHVPNM